MSHNENESHADTASHSVNSLESAVVLLIKLRDGSSKHQLPEIYWDYACGFGELKAESN